MLSNIGGLNFEEISNTEAGPIKSVAYIKRRIGVRIMRDFYQDFYIKCKRHHLEF